MGEDSYDNSKRRKRHRAKGKTDVQCSHSQSHTELGSWNGPSKCPKLQQGDLAFAHPHQLISHRRQAAPREGANFGQGAPLPPKAVPGNGFIWKPSTAHTPTLQPGSWGTGERGPRGRPGASLVAQWLRICLPMQGTRVRALVQEDPTCRGATRPVSHNY